MSEFYIEAIKDDGDNVLFELTATTEVKISMPGQATTNKVESGSNISDHINLANKKVRMIGIVSNIKRVNKVRPDDAQRNMQDFFRELEKERDLGTRFKVYFASGQALDNCVAVSLDFDRVSGGSNHYVVSWEFEQIQVRSRNEVLTGLVVKPKEPNKHKKEEDQGDNTASEEGPSLGELLESLFTGSDLGERTEQSTLVERPKEFEVE